ncbi:MAG: family 10 glycosylhydrolase [Planctomycetes bacterium]|nr:family 10 glycosylhydrolase [Planctomycetota bacterium]
MRFAPFLALLAALPAQTAEIRGVWVARDGLTSRGQIQTTLDRLQAANINLVAVNVWSRGYTLWPSDVLQSAGGVRQDPGFIGRDPLQEFLTEAHRRGIQVEAWFEYGFMACWSGWFPGNTGNGPVLTAHPDWAAMDQSGNTRVADGNGGYFTWFAHEHPAAQQFLIDLTTELVDRYDVDGVQWDRIRYPSLAFGYDPTTIARYRAAHNNQSPPANTNNPAWKRWRADGLNAFALQLAQAIRARRSTVAITNAPVPADTAYNSYLQDWPQWLVAGAVDFVYPQIYRTTIADYTSLLNLNLSRVRTQDRARFAPGIRAISGTPTADVLAMVALNRQLNLPGSVFWYAEGLYDDLPSLAAQYYQQPASVPPRPVNWRPAPTIVDDADPAVAFVGAWNTVTGTAWHQGAARTLPAGQPPTAAATFPLAPTEAGLWRVLLHAPSGASFSTAAPVHVHHAAGSTRVHIDLTAPGSAGWRELATVWLDPALGPASVQVLVATQGSVIADGAMLLRSRQRGGAAGHFGAGTNGSLGVPGIGLSGNGAPGGRLELQVHSVPAGSAAITVLGVQGSLVPALGGTLYVVPAATELRVADARGVAASTLLVPFSPTLAGLSVFAQGLLLDPLVPAGAAWTQAVSAVLQ